MLVTAYIPRCGASGGESKKCYLKLQRYFMRLLRTHASTEIAGRCWDLPRQRIVFFGRDLIFLRVATCSGLYSVLCARDICNSVISVLRVKQRRWYCPCNGYNYCRVYEQPWMFGVLEKMMTFFFPYKTLMGHRYFS